MAFKIPQEITPQEVEARLLQGEQLYMLDVREPDEWAAGHVAGTVNFPLSQLAERQHELAPGRETIVMCRSGGRSGLACELLSEKGFRVVNMTGGLNAWTGSLA
ncbi:rhodanese-like domain-containing protein [Paenibacillus rhizovicinus]|uniref:Rhodanese-like domain-containing protein n=1 Tax=Paenibacillus rhizovicinus TaxID=2704463 RepID=A0A6C0P6Y0_9BACL|nr:rhodanese-like domain-containing protein [Paenibacillus rhizovicinus]QHW32352.1 rhodanese-like domain-containing protein [Paenibacillus rhizovicinus]